MKQGDRVVCIDFTPPYEGKVGRIIRMKKTLALVEFDIGWSTTIPIVNLRKEKTP